MKRELGSFERALVITDQHAPFHIVNVLSLENPPSPQILRHAIKVLQNHHPFLSSHIVHEKGRYYLESLDNAPVPLHVLPRWNNEHWVQIAEVELGNRFDIAAGPLFRCVYLYREGDPHAEVIFSFFHSIADSASISQLISEFLTICAFFWDQKTVTVYELDPAPPVESRFPVAYKGLRLCANILRYALGQLADEISYRIRTRGKRIPSLLNRRPNGRILSVRISEEETESFSRCARKEGVTLNSALNAMMLLALNRTLYAGQHVPMRTFSFADLRPYVRPPLSNVNLACYISMLRFTVNVRGDMGLWELAGDLHQKIYSSLKSGDKFVASVMAESLMKMVTRWRSFRMGATGLNYSGVVPIRREYGEMRVLGLHGFVSGYDLGPELSVQAHLVHGELILDLLYLDGDMTQNEARAIAEEIKRLIHSQGSS